MKSEQDANLRQPEGSKPPHWPGNDTRAAPVRLSMHLFSVQRLIGGRMLALMAALLVIGTLHYLIPHSAPFWHYFFQWLYYLPVLLSAMQFGFIGGIAAAALASLGFLPHLLWSSEDHASTLAVTSAQLVVLFLVAAVAGVLADRERRRTEELRQTSAKLFDVHRELEASIEQLKRSDRLSAIGELAASIAHEIRNPLASIQGAADILGNGRIPVEVRQEFQQILRNECVRLERLLSSLLDFTRQPRRPEFRNATLNDVFESVVNLIAHNAGRRGVRLRTDTSPNAPQFECDPQQIAQVILNLTLNAVQAMPQGGEVLLSARGQDQNMLIQVRDEGTGIADEDLERIFDPFFTTKENGTGIGLYVVHQIVDQHAGQIRVRRNEVRGMTFSVLLPLRQARAARKTQTHRH